jgi:hypothetical protein
VTLREARAQRREGDREPRELEGDPFELDDPARDPAQPGRTQQLGLRTREIRAGAPGDLLRVPRRATRRRPGKKARPSIPR